jgi:2-hydroxy-6-oxonona-2,4-dienedioate hydrolase
VTLAATVTPHRYLSEALVHADVRRLLASATRRETEHPGGRVVWHEWGRGPALVLLHGGFGSWLHWVRNIDALSARFRVLAADLPGLGESDPVPADPPDAAAVAAPLVAGVRELLPPGESFDLACFSLGTVIGGQVAVALPDRVRQVALLGPSGLGEYWRNITGELARRRPDMAREELRATVRQNLRESMIAGEDAIDDLAIDVHADLLRQKRRLVGMPLSKSSALIDALPRLEARLTIFWGERDGYAAPDVPTVAARLRARLPGLRTEIIAGAGHWIPYEAAGEVNARLAALFSKMEKVA